MTILGISISHDGSISIVKNGVNLFSLAEERLNRRKAYIGFPFKALRYVVENKIILPEEINLVTISQNVFLRDWAFIAAFSLTEDKTYYDIQNETKPKKFRISDTDYLKIKNDSDCNSYVINKIKNILMGVGISAKIKFIDHHLSHAASSYYSSGFKDALSVTMDGEGDQLSATINICKEGKIKRISSTSVKNSAGYLYSEVTRKCGFKISRHEGKITGLAAYGNYKKFEKEFDTISKVSNGTFRINNFIQRSFFNKIKNKLFSFFGSSFKMGHEEVINRFNFMTDEDLASCIQNHLEKRISEIVRYWVDKTNIENVVLAGGVFANVKFNQRISEIQKIKGLYIFPGMGDGGTAYGSAIYEYFKSNNFEPEKHIIRDVYLGPSFNNNYVKKLLSNYEGVVKFKKSKNVSLETAQLLAKGNIIGWFQGKMEFGPRALGNRSIIAPATDREINRWLNERMERTEFMPFAPSCLSKFSNELFEINNDELKFPANFMTITFNMKQKWVKKTPAVAHIDNTARPQLVDKKTNEKYYNLINEYYKITGLPLIINTSFNVHEEPIVCKPEEGLKSLLNSVIDVYVCEDYICFLNK